MKAAQNLTMFTATAGLLAIMTAQANAGSGTTEVVAGSVTAPTEVAVNLSDLNLNSVDGQTTLHYRLARAAEQVCGPGDIRRAGSVSLAARNDECAEESLSRALSKVTASSLVSVSVPSR